MFAELIGYLVLDYPWMLATRQQLHHDQNTVLMLLGITFTQMATKSYKRAHLQLSPGYNNSLDLCIIYSDKKDRVLHRV